jgi:enhancing lycopene biosynthesis protein 2
MPIMGSIFRKLRSVQVGNKFHLITEGMAETNIIIAETKKIKRTEFRNLTTVTVENCDDVRKELVLRHVEG